MKRKKKVATKKTPVKRIRKPKEAKEGVYMGLPYESFCELSCIFMAEEMMKLGYVEKITRSESYLMCDPVVTTHAVQLKRGSKSETQTVSNSVTYTPDFVIHFRRNALGLFAWELGSPVKWNKKHFIVQKDHSTGLYVAHIEVKPDFSRNSTTPMTVIKMKWLYQRLGVFTNLFRPDRVFSSMFTPQKYMLTANGSLRKIKYKFIGIQEYIKSQKK